METTTTDTPYSRVSRSYVGDHIDYWSTIDCVDCELSGYSLKYKRPIDLDDALGVNTNYTFHVLRLLRNNLSNSK